MGQNVMLLPGQLGERLQGHAPSMVQLHLGIQNQQQGEHVGEAEAAPQAAAHSSQIAELHAHNVAQALLNSTAVAGILCKCCQGS
mgnify:CR=1 FL=1